MVDGRIDTFSGLFISALKIGFLCTLYLPPYRPTTQPTSARIIQQESTNDTTRRYDKYHSIVLLSIVVVMSDSENRYGVAALDQLDEDEPTTSPPPIATTEEKSSSHANVAQVESFATAVGVIEPPPDLKGSECTAKCITTIGSQSTRNSFPHYPRPNIAHNFCITPYLVNVCVCIYFSDY